MTLRLGDVLSPHKLTEALGHQHQQLGIRVQSTIRFVMEELPPAICGSAWIEPHTGMLRIGTIQAIYATIAFCRQDPEMGIAERRGTG